MAFRVNTNGQGHTVLKVFTGPDDPAGLHPQGVTLSGSVLYGTTQYGGNSDFGTVFRMNTNGSGYSVLKHFTEPIYNPSTETFTNSHGAYPDARVTLAGGTLYGTTAEGGHFGYGTVFKLSTNGGGFTALKHFAGTNGAQCRASLTVLGDVIYGTTEGGGNSSAGTVFRLSTDGTGYMLLKQFTGGDGAYPRAGLTLFGGALYGTTSEGGALGEGTLFKINLDGTGFSVVKHFTGQGDGARPYAGLTLSGFGLYGATSRGGIFDLGTVFKLDFSPRLAIQSLGDSVVLSWSNSAFALQAAPAVPGIYTNIPGATSSYTNAGNGPQRFFRLIME